MTKEEREDAIEVIKAYKANLTNSVSNQLDGDIKAFDMAIKVLEQEPETGHWIEKDGFDGDVYYDCSECGESWTTIEGTPWDNGMNYCPNCGAKMEVEK